MSGQGGLRPINNQDGRQMAGQRPRRLRARLPGGRDPQEGRYGSGGFFPPPVRIDEGPLERRPPRLDFPRPGQVAGGGRKEKRLPGSRSSKNYKSACAVSLNLISFRKFHFSLSRCRDGPYGCPAFMTATRPSNPRTGVNPVPTWDSSPNHRILVM